MPQISQLSEIFYSQLFWLAVVFGIIYFGIGRAMVPKIQSTIDARRHKIADELEIAQTARSDAEATEASYRKHMDASRAEAMKLAQAAQQEAARDAELLTRAVDQEIGEKITKAEADIRGSFEAAMAELDGIAVEAAREIFAKLTGKTVSGAEVSRAVKAVRDV